MARNKSNLRKKSRNKSRRRKSKVKSRRRKSSNFKKKSNTQSNVCSSLGKLTISDKETTIPFTSENIQLIDLTHDIHKEILSHITSQGIEDNNTLIGIVKYCTSLPILFTSKNLTTIIDRYPCRPKVINGFGFNFLPLSKFYRENTRKFWIQLQHLINNNLFKQLETLDLKNTDFNERIYSYGFDFLKNSFKGMLAPNLKQLLLSGCLIGSEGVESLIEGNFPSLVELDLNYNELQSEDFSTLSRGNFPQLTNLNISNNWYEPFKKGIKDLGNGKLSQLKYLNISMNNIVVIDVVALAEGNWSQLESLDISNNLLYLEGAQVLAAKFHNTLVELYISMNHLKYEGVQELIKFKWPRLKVLNIFSRYENMSFVSNYGDLNEKKEIVKLIKESGMFRPELVISCV